MIYTIEREIDLAPEERLRNNFLFHTKNEERNEGRGERRRQRETNEGAEVRQFRSRGAIDRDDVQIILFSRPPVEKFAATERAVPEAN